MTRPLRSTPITGASPLLRAGPPAGSATVLTPAQRAGCLPLTHPETRTSSIGFGLLPFHAEAADRARVASMPDTAWPISGHPPGSSRDLVDTPVSMSPVSVSTRQQRFAHARLPDPHLTRHTRLFHIAHHGRVTAPAACGGLKPPPQGDFEGPTIPHLLHSTASRSSTYIELLSTFGTHPQADAAARQGSAPTRPPRNRQTNRPCRCRRLEFAVDRHRKSTRIGTRSSNCGQYVAATNRPVILPSSFGGISSFCCDGALPT